MEAKRLGEILKRGDYPFSWLFSGTYGERGRSIEIRHENKIFKIEREYRETVLHGDYEVLSKMAEIYTSIGYRPVLTNFGLRIYPVFNLFTNFTDPFRIIYDSRSTAIGAGNTYCLSILLQVLGIEYIDRNPKPLLFLASTKMKDMILHKDIVYDDIPTFVKRLLEVNGNVPDCWCQVKKHDHEMQHTFIRYCIDFVGYVPAGNGK